MDRAQPDGMTTLTGHSMGHYTLLEQIGQGGMASVYRAYDPSSDCVVAVKVLSPAMAQHPSFSERFRREARLLTQLKHPNLVPVIDFGETSGFAYLVMPFLRVGSLADRLKQGPLTIRAAVLVIEQIAAGLEFAHRHGVVHRDVKPSNILIDDRGDALLSDFGLAQIQDASLSLTGSAFIGTPAYISPEQARGGEVDPRADQYALGIILYQMATGRLPFEAETPLAVLLKHMSEPLPPPRRVNPDVPELVERVILKATAKVPDHRFDTVEHMAGAFRQVVEHLLEPDQEAPPRVDLVEEPPPLTAEPAIDHHQRKARRWPLARIGVVAGILVVMLLCPLSGLVFRNLTTLQVPLLSSARPRSADQPMESAALQATLEALPTITPSPAPLLRVGGETGPKPLLAGAQVSAEGPCTAISIAGTRVDEGRVSWYLNNAGNVPLSADRVLLAWPKRNGGLVSLNWGRNRIWEAGDDLSPAVIETNAATAPATIPPDSDTSIEFRFTEPAASLGYRLVLSMAEGCALGIES